MPDFHRDPASFRDDRGYILHGDARVLRVVTSAGADDARAARATGLIERLIAAGWLLEEREVPLDTVARPDARLVFEHPVLPFVSHPYEWPFLALQAAALLHLDIQIAALDAGVALSDATAFNVQFIGARPVFIDHLSFRPYREGELWAGHRQFCEQFLYPLILSAYAGVPFHAWYRGRLEGIPGDELLRVLPLRDRWRWRVLTNLVLPVRLQRVAARRSVTEALRAGGLPRRSFRRMLIQLRSWVAGLTAAGAEETTWAAYDDGVVGAHTAAKTAFIDTFIRHARPRLVWDFGCNVGRYAQVALEAGAGYVVGFDLDTGALHRSFERARDRRLRFLPLLQDLGNPTPSQGWRERERAGLGGRARADAILALALAHHLALARNVPLDQLVEVLTGFAPEGVIEFVPKHDPRAAELVRLREELFRDYTVENFVALMSRRARIVREAAVPDSSRVLFWFSRDE